MPYVHRDENNAVVKITSRPSGSDEKLPEDHPDVVAFRNRPRPLTRNEREQALAVALDAAPDDAARWALLAAHFRP